MREQITERLRDPRGLRRGGFPGAGPRNVAANGARQRGFVRPVRRIRISFICPFRLRFVFLSLWFWIVTWVAEILALGFGLQADRTENEDQPPAKRRLLSAVVKVRVFLLFLFWVRSSNYQGK